VTAAGRAGELILPEAKLGVDGLRFLQRDGIFRGEADRGVGQISRVVRVAA
jgi:hypothetical protein